MNKAFAEAQGYSYPLLCDEDRAFSLALGACTSATGRSKRIFAIVNKDLSFTTQPCQDCEQGPVDLLAQL